MALEVPGEALAVAAPSGAASAVPAGASAVAAPSGAASAVPAEDLAAEALLAAAGVDAGNQIKKHGSKEPCFFC